MYDGFDNSGGKAHSAEWRKKTQAFNDHAFAGKTHYLDQVRCPCNEHNNGKFQTKEELTKDRVNYGLMPDYEMWSFHGKKETRVETEGEANDDLAGVNRMDEMLEALQPEFGLNSEDPPTKEVGEFFKPLQASEEPLHEHTKVSLLAFVTRLIAIKSKYFFSNNCFNDLVQLIRDVLPQPHKLRNDMYQCKRLTKALSMGYEKIDMCPDGCMLFCDDHVDEKKCLKCGKGRYVEVVNEDGDHVTMDVAQKQLRSFPMAPHFKWLFLSMKTCEYMRWSKEGVRDNSGFIGHPADSDAWKALDEFDPEFAKDARNIRFGLATDGFTPFGQSATSYSCWPVFIIPYNLPPHMCMKYEFVFFCLIIPGPEHPGQKISVMLQPLIKELKQLWYGVEAYDISLKQKFTLRAAYLWSVHDFMAYEFQRQNWTSKKQPTSKQLDKMQRDGIDGKPNFPDWFKIYLSEVRVSVRSHGRYDVNGFRMSRRFKQVAKRFVGKMIPSKERLFQGSTSIGSGREALLRCVDSKLQGVPIALQRNEDEEDEEADGEDAGDRQENEEAGDRDGQEDAQADEDLMGGDGSEEVTNSWLKSQGQPVGHFRDASETYLTTEEYGSISHPLFEDQPGPYKALCDLWTSEEFQERSRKHRNVGTKNATHKLGGYGDRRVVECRRHSDWPNMGRRWKDIMVKDLIGELHPLTLKLCMRAGSKSHGQYSMFNGVIDSRQVQRRSSSQSLGSSSSRQHRTTSKMKIDSLRQEIQKRDAFLKAQEEYQKEQQAHTERLHSQQMAAIQAQGMTFVMPEVAPVPVPPQWGMFAQMSFSLAPQQSGQHIDPALGDFVNNLFASGGSGHNSNEPDVL
ncbi:hypothetical protein U9M48_002684 [Paspalum notatum var. saurae]|uniref:Transposase-associated domain-containing protein n=1 Tax=Paspalum notatum var. saurae TaxID=547442 RepID=A0AAQ3PRF4_PASNO